MLFLYIFIAVDMAITAIGLNKKDLYEVYE
jgi:hypothetical protein